LAVCHQLRARIPEAQIWVLRVGSRYVHRFRSPRPGHSGTLCNV
jgi:hypothetical protein